MTFLNTLFLSLLPAVFLPLIIHLFTRSKNKTVRFSTLDFLKELENKQIRKLKLRQLLLLILRCLIILFLVLAFARPTLKGSLTGVLSPNAKTTMALVIDNSVSMGLRSENGTLLQQVKSRAAELLDTGSSGDDVFILTAADTIRTGANVRLSMIERAKEMVDQVPLYYGEADLTKTLRLADQLLAESENLNKELYLFSDFQQSAFLGDSLSLQADKKYAVAFRTSGNRNLSITGALIGSTIFEKGKVIDLRAEIANNGTTDVNDVLIQLFIEGQAVAQNSVSLNAGDRSTVSFKFVLNRTGHLSGHFLLEEDDLPEDNARFFTIYVPDRIRVALVGQPADTKYLSIALRPDPAGQLFAVTTVKPEQLGLTTLDFDVVVLSNLNRLDEEVVERLQSFVNAGGGLLFVAGPNLDIRSFNSGIAPRLGLPRFAGTIGSLDAEASFAIDYIDLLHPLFEGVFEQNEINLVKPSVRFALKTDKTTAVQEIIRYSNGDPFLYEKSHESGRMLVMTTSLDLRTTDLPHRTLFSPLVTRSVIYLGLPHQTLRGKRIGDILEYSLSPARLGAALAMERPDARSDRLQPDVRQTGPWVSYSDSDLPGIYRLFANEELLSQWAVNIPESELDMLPLKQDNLESNFSLNVLDKDVDFDQLVRQNRYGTELWKIFAIIVLALMVIEMLIYRQKE